MPWIEIGPAPGSSTLCMDYVSKEFKKFLDDYIENKNVDINVECDEKGDINVHCPDRDIRRELHSKIGKILGNFYMKVRDARKNQKDS